MELPPISERDLTRARRIVRKHMLRYFGALMASREDLLLKAGASGSPLIVYTNYPGRWNGTFMLVLAEMMPGRVHRAPMNAEVLSHYPLLRRAGGFPVDGATARGGFQFVRTAARMLAQGEVLWITPEGRSVDPRCRPLVFKPGLAAVASRLAGDCLALPCAFEYAVWDGRRPEALAHFGEPLRVSGLTQEDADEHLKRGLETTMDELKQLSTARNAAAFRVIGSGTSGVLRLQEYGRRATAKLRGGIG